MAESATLSLVTLSHSPLLAFNEPGAGVRARVEEAFERARRFISDVDPQLVVLFAPDHYNSFLYDLMPPFCIGRAASAIGDYATPAGELSVDHRAASVLIEAVLDGDVDVAYSERMTVDHGFAQPLQILFGGLTSVPVVPIFINSVAEPLGPVRRIRRLGEEVGRACLQLGARVLVVASGGLSHDPPLPRLDTAPPPVREVLIHAGRQLSPEDRHARQERVITAGLDYAAGRPTPMQPLNPDWDRQVLEVLASGDLTPVDHWTPAWFAEQGGHSSHEVRTWIAAYAALGAAGPYTVTSTFYEAIPAWVAGFSVTTAIPTPPT